MNLKSTLFAVVAICLTAEISAQCEPDFDFGEAAWGASPDASVGEQFDIAYLGVPYEDVFHVLVPEDASAIEPTIDFPLDSVILVSATLIDTVTMVEVPFEEVGLEIVCNNNGVSPNPCTLVAPGQYCANLQGTPSQAGVYQMSLNVLAYVTVFGQPVGQPFDFSGYILDIVDDNSSVGEEGFAQAALYPNPANGLVTLKAFTGQNGQMLDWHVRDITGREVRNGSTTDGRAVWDVSQWNDGVYFVTWSQGQQVHTRRLVVRH